MSANDTWNTNECKNDTTSNPDQQWEPELFTIYIQFTAILTLIVVTVTGNLLLLAIVFRSPQLRSTVSNALIVNLAVADSLIGIFVLPAFAATVWRLSRLASARRSGWLPLCCPPSRS